MNPAWVVLIYTVGDTIGLCMTILLIFALFGHVNLGNVKAKTFLPQLTGIVLLCCFFGLGTLVGIIYTVRLALNLPL